MGAFCNTFNTSLSYHLSLRPLFYLFLSGCLRQVLQDKWIKSTSHVLIKLLTKCPEAIFLNAIKCEILLKELTDVR